ncbi:hypothetical protein GQF03_07845 [Sneathiella chungangensis]|uniref:Uncharacterized protein n=1 Tax=Sneathiella chungangensis TaxID=1418234 RepID=A0A845ME44_9PROT|nr:hypothetical protein [Sneathiella chungangensis]MZR22238.1 hypothetical protein [Sneathiella chungangensis]
MIRKTIAAAAVLSAVIGFTANATAADYKVALGNLIDSDVRSWAQSDTVVNAIKEQNKSSAALSQADIDAKDKQWRAETKGGDQKMINAVLANSLSAYLKDVKEKSQGKYTEIFVMDMKGLNVGQSDVTSDYWQGDEAKWQKTYGAGPAGVLIDEVEFDDSSQTYQSQVSVAIVDPATKEPIGAVTVGVNVEMLE